MKKKLTLLAVCMLCLCLLAGCGCSHEWNEADCLTAKTCSKCGATDEHIPGHDFAPATCTAAETCSRCGATNADPLGHDFAPATCITPEICGICGITQGEPLPHNYSNWTIHETEMTRSCTICNAVESHEIDRELYLKQLLCGHWDYQYLVKNNQIAASAENLAPGSAGPYFRFQDNGEVIFFDGTNEILCTLELESYSPEAGSELYYFTLSTENGAQHSLLLLHGNSDELGWFTGENTYFTFFRDDLLTSLLSDGWADVKDNFVYTLHLNPDHTFSGNLGEEISGTWMLRPITYNYGSRSCFLTLRYIKDGEPVVLTVNLPLGPQSISLEQYFTQDCFIPLNLNGTYLTLRPASGENIAELENGLVEGKREITGNWICKAVQRYTQNGESKTVPDNYSIRFAEDGTFTAMLDKERSGTWMLTDVRVSPDAPPAYDYELYFDGVKEPVSARLDDYGEFTLISYGQTDIIVRFMTEADAAQLDQNRKEGNAAILGTWNSTCICISTTNNGVMTQAWKPATNYTILFHEDGTFTAGFDRDYAGTWSYTDFYAYDDGVNQFVDYQYDLRIHGVDQTIFTKVSNGHLQFSGSDGNIGRSVHCGRYSQNDLALMKKGPGLLEGTWKTVSADSATKDYTLTVNADGSFTAHFDRDYAGTWAYFGYTAENGYEFSFFGDNGIQGNTWYLQNEKDLMVWLSEPGSDFIRFTMNKS